MYEDVVIVTRHLGTVEWLNRRGIRGKVISRAKADDIDGSIVVGNPPLHLAYLAQRVGIVEIPKLPHKLRGRELTADELEHYGAKVTWYTVTRHEES